MNITELAIYKKMFGGGTSGATAYTVSSVDELPSNAVDGSMAIVESDSIVGEWELNETLTSINKPFEEGFEIINSGGFLGYYYFEELEIPYIRPDYFNHFIFIGDATHLEELLYASIDKGETVSEISVYNSDEGYTSQMASRKIQILKDTDDDVFKQWLPENATRISGGYSLYTHENGQWGYKCEVV